MRINTWEEAKKVLDEHPEAYKQALNNQIIHELKKIKEEITRWCNGYFQDEIGKDINKIIDKHISELKGEQE